MKSLKIPFGILVCCVCFSCTSALSDIELDDPSVVRVNFRIEKTLDSEKTIEEDITASIQDKNGASVELKKGGVYVNGNEMYFKWPSKDYIIDDPRIRTNEQYEFNIVLADGIEYLSSVRTPKKYFGDVSAPQVIIKNENISISWADIDPEGKIKIVLISHRDNLTWVTHYNKTVDDTGTILIKKEDLDYENVDVGTISFSELLLKRETVAETNPAFKDGGKTKAVFTYRHKFSLTN